MADEVTRLTGRRVTIGFVPTAVTDLDWLVANKGYKQNDAANRAVQVYAFIERELAKGKKLKLENPDGSTETINII
jgi:hypothetical protein